MRIEAKCTCGARVDIESGASGVRAKCKCCGRPIDNASATNVHEEHAAPGLAPASTIATNRNVRNFISTVTDRGDTPMFLVRYILVVPPIVAAMTAASLIAFIGVLVEGRHRPGGVDWSVANTILTMCLIGHGFLAVSVFKACRAGTTSTLIGLGRAAWIVILAGSYLAGLSLTLWVVRNAPI